MITITVDGAQTVSALLDMPERATACLVLAHGAGAGMTHAFMAAVAGGLSARRIATLRFQFPAMEAGLSRPDRPARAHATIRAAVETASRLAPDLPLFAGGKSFGGRMTSQAQADAALADVRALVFFGFPLHPAKRPATERADHLSRITLPLLFLQGTRDGLADIGLIEDVVRTLGTKVELFRVEDADHSFHVPARSGRTDAQVMDLLLDATAAWMGRQ